MNSERDEMLSKLDSIRLEIEHLYELGEYQSALNKTIEYRGIIIRKIGIHCLDYVIAEKYFGILCQVLGRYEEAYMSFDKIDKILNNIGETKNVEFSRNLSNLGSVCQSIGKHSAAIDYYWLAVKHLKDHGLTIDLFKTYSNLSQSLIAIGRIDEATQLMDESFKYLLDAKMPETDRSVLIANYANLMYSTGNYQKCESLYRGSIELINKNYGEKHPIYFQLLINLTEFLLVTNKFSEAKNIFVKIHINIEDFQKYDEPIVADTLLHYAKLCISFEEVESAIKYLIESIAIFEKFGIVYKAAIGLNYLGVLYEQTGNYSEAEAIHKKCISIYTNIGSNDYLANSIYNLGCVYLAKNDYSSAEEYINKALILYSKLGMKDGLFYNRALHRIAQVKIKQGRLDEANKYFKLLDTPYANLPEKHRWRKEFDNDIDLLNKHKFA